MHMIRVQALVLLFHRNMEYWGRGDPIPGHSQDVLTWVTNRDLNAVMEAQSIVMDV